MEHRISENMTYYYCGLFYFFLAKTIADATELLLYMTIGFLNLSIWVIPTVLAVVCLMLIYLLLFHQKKPIKIKSIFFILIVITSMALSHLLSYDLFLTNYSILAKALTYSFIVGIKSLFLLSIGVIAYIKYFKQSRKSKESINL